MASSHGLLNSNATDNASIDNPGFVDYNYNRYSWSEISQTKKKFAFGAVVFLLVAIPYIILIVLYNNLSQTNVTNNYYTELPVVTGTLTAAQTIKFGTPVSISSTGAVQAGGGTSIYKNILEMNQDCPEYLGIDAIFGDMYLVSYFDAASKGTTFSVISIGPNPNQATVQNTQSFPYQVFETATLSQSDGTFVAITQDFSSSEETAYVIGGSIDAANGYAITLTISPEVYTNIYSIDPQITRLSDTSFAIAYYRYGSESTLFTQYGTYNALGGIISLSEAVSFLEDMYNSTYMDLVGLTPHNYLLIYYSSNSTYSSAAATGPLQVQVAYVEEVTADSGSSSTIVKFREPATTLLNSQIAFSFVATRVSNSTAVIAFVSPQSNYGVSCLSIELSTEFEGTGLGSNYSVVFGPSWAVSSGESLATTDFGNMDLDIVTVSDAGQFMVLFSDISNQGIMTAALGWVGPSAITRASPSFLLSAPNPNVNKNYYWGALAAGSTTPYAGQVAILSALSDFTCNDATTSQLSIMEILPPPVGVSTSVRVGGTVALAGVISNYKSLVPGQLYYTTTMGQLVSAGGYYGTSPDPAACAAGSAYVEDLASGTIVTIDSQVGLATSAESLLLKLV